MGGGAAPVLEPAEHALNQIALLVEAGVVGDRDLVALSPNTVAGDLQIGQGLADPVAP
jgi:hypothetical protein